MEENSDSTLKVVSVIPARGGSKGVPKKNIRLLAGKPLIYYTIKASIDSGVVDETFVSTDDEEIARISRECGAKVIERPAELSQDHNSSESALHHALSVLRNQGHNPEIIVFLQATSPLRGSEVIKEAVTKLLEGDKYDSVLSAYKDYRYYGPLENGYYKPFRKERQRRQDMESYYCDNGAVYAFRTFVLEKFNNRYGEKVGLVIMSEEDSKEIDTEFELWFLDKFIEHRKK